MRQKLPGENTSTVIRYSYNGKHGKEKTAVEKEGSTAGFSKNGNIAVEKERMIWQDFGKWEIYPQKKSEGYGRILENGKYTRRKRVKGTAEFWKMENIPAEKE